MTEATRLYNAYTDIIYKMHNRVHDLMQTRSPDSISHHDSRFRNMCVKAFYKQIETSSVDTVPDEVSAIAGINDVMDQLECLCSAMAYKSGDENSELEHQLGVREQVSVMYRELNDAVGVYLARVYMDRFMKCI